MSRRTLITAILAASITVPLAVNALTLTRALSLGSTGPDVTSLQQILAQQGFLAVQPTGYFGTLTQAAVEKYQAAHNIVSQGTPDTTGYGDVGPKTLASLNGTPTSANPNQPLIDQLLAEVKALEAQIAAILAGNKTTTPLTTSGATAGASGISLPSQAQVPAAAGGGGGGSSANGNSSAGNGGSNNYANSSSACPKGSSYQDGCASAPTGTIQFPSLLTAYGTHRTPWNVPAVDYYVGVPSTITLKDPTAGTLPSCASYNASTHVVTITANNCTINGYDFTKAGGIQIYNPAYSGLTITNNSFGASVNTFGSGDLIDDRGPGQTTITNNTFANDPNNVPYGDPYGSGTTLVEYNYFYNLGGDALDFGGSSYKTIVKYNAFVQLGMTAGTHPDTVQLCGGTLDPASVMSYNLIYQPSQVVVGGEEGIQVSVQCGNPSITGYSADHNTLIAATGGPAPDGVTMSDVITISALATNVQVVQNYVDARGAYGYFYPTGDTSDTCSGNISMTNGSEYSGGVTYNYTAGGAITGSFGNMTCTGGGSVAGGRFSNGQYVSTLATANVRQTAAGTLLGTQPAGAVATVVGGPVSAPLSGTTYTWWNLNFTSGVDGWVADDNLSAYALDTSAPSIPTGLSVSAVSSSQIYLTWNAASDNVGVTGYTIYRNGSPIGTSATNSYNDLGLSASTAYSYTVSAYDAAGNTSVQSASASATTQASTAVNCTTGVWNNLEACGWPGPANTGPDMTQCPNGLTNSGAMTISTPNTVVSCMNVTGGITVNAQNVTIKNSKVSNDGGGAGGTGVISIGANSSATIDHVDLNGLDHTHACIWDEGTKGSTLTYSMVAKSVNCHDVNDGIFSWSCPGAGTCSVDTGAGSDFIIQDSYFHDFTENAANGHIDGYQTEGARNGTITHNTYKMARVPGDVTVPGGGMDSAIAIWDDYNEPSPTGLLTTNITISNNLLAGGGFTGYSEDLSPGDGSSGSTAVGGNDMTNIKWLNNKFSTLYGSCVGTWGTWFYRGPGESASLVWPPYYGGPTDGWNIGGSERSGNVVLETGENIDTGGPTGCEGHNTSPAAPSGSDTQAPSTPTSLSATAVSSSQINLSWTASTDNVGVTGYNIYRNGTKIGTATTNSYSSTGLSASTNYSYTVSAYDAAGNTSAQSASASATTQASVIANSCPRGSSYQDGCSGAPAGSAQHPSLLSSYVTRAPWNVAGVDYYVGVPSNVTLADWENLSIPGCTVNIASHYVRCDNTSGIVISGVDFSLHGGANVFFVNSPNATVKNSNFGGPNLTTISADVIYADASSPNLTVEYDTIDGAGAGSGSGLVAAGGGGTTVLMYNWLKNYPQHVLETSAIGPSNAITYKYNLIEQGAMQSGAHLNFLQICGSGTDTSIDVEYNTSYQTPEASGGEGYQFLDGCGSGSTINNVTWSSNTMIASGAGTAMSYLIHAGGSQNNGIGRNNYIDPTAAYGTFYGGSLTGWTLSGNIDMNNGKTINADNTESGGSDTQAPSTPTSLSATAVSSSQINLSWTASTDNVGVTGYNIYRNGTKIGTATTNSYSSTGLSASTNYSYTVSAYDAAGNTSAQSASASATTQASVIANSCPRGSSYPDGCANAPAGTAQMPTILNGYATRPPWNVAGVDYHVGITAGTVLKSPTSISSPSLSITGSTIRCTGGSVTLDGYDLTGYTIYNPSGGCTSITITNSKFACPSSWSSVSPFAFIGDQNNAVFTLKNNEFDMAGCGAWPNDLSDPLNLGSGTVQYNFFTQEPERIISPGCAPLNFSYNVIENPNPEAGAHMNMMQQGCGSGGTQTGLVVQYNTLYDAQNPFGGGGEGWQFEGASSQQFTSVSPTFTNNTVITLPYNGQPVASFLVHGFCQDGSNCSTTAVTLSGTGNFSNNYFDASGAYGVFYTGQTAMWPSNAVMNNNIDLKTGSLIPSPNATASATDTTPPTISITAPSGQLAAGTTSTTLSVTTNENATCAWSNTGGSAFGSMTQFATTGGTSHSTTLSGLTNGSSYTTYVKCKDTAGNISTDSSTSYSVAQSTQASTGTGSGGTTSSSCSQATSFLSRVSVDAAHQTDYTNLICGLVTDGIWNKLDVFYVFATQNSSAALANLVSSSFTATPTGAPTFTADSGYTLGTSDSVNSNYNFATNGTNYTQDSASIGGWSGQAAASWYCTWMTSTQYCGNTNLHALDAGSPVVAFSINGTSLFSVSNTADGSGLFVLVRPDANTESVYRNGASLGSVSRSSVALENGTFEAGPGINRAMFAGGALSATDVSNLYSLLSAYMQSVGATP